MTALDQVRKLEQEVIDRLKELEPLIREYEDLRDIAQRLELHYTPGSAGSASAAPARKATTSRRKTGAKRASTNTTTSRRKTTAKQASANATSTRASARNAATKPRSRRAASNKASTQAEAGSS